MKLPDSLTKRNLLHSVKGENSDVLLSIAKAFEEKGQLSDAADFYAKSKNTSNLDALADRAVASGDTFLLLKILRLAGKEANAAMLEPCAQKAESLGKVRYAILAHERLGHDDKVEELKSQIADDLDMQADAKGAEIFIPTSVEEIDEE